MSIWTRLGLAILIGGAVGVVAALAANFLGLSGVITGGVAGGLAAGLVAATLRKRS